jgi:hypothetical protein
MVRSKFYRDVTNYSMVFLITAGLMFHFGEKSWWPNFYQPVFYSIIFPFCAFLIYLPKLIFKNDSENKRTKVVLLQFAIAVALMLNALGELYFYQLYKYGIQYDKIIHFSNSLLFVVISTFFIEAWFNLSYKKALGASVILVLASSILWEVFEFSSDLFFKTVQFGVYGQDKTTDTIFDIISDVSGVLFSSYFLLNYKYNENLIKKTILSAVIDCIVQNKIITT